MSGAESADLTPQQAEVLGRPLADALAYRKERATGYCAACEREYGGLCYDHAGDEKAADGRLGSGHSPRLVVLVW